MGDDPDANNPEYMGRCALCGNLGFDVFPRKMTPAESRQWDDDFRKQREMFG